jgi:uncharacterized protein with FMN-binding domain
MRRITLWLFSTIAAVVLLFTYRTSLDSGGATASAAVVATAPATTPTTTDPTADAASPQTPSSSASASSSTSTSASPSSSASSSSSGSSSAGTKTYTGSVASTRWGDVQVSITVAGGKITNVAVPVYPTGNGRDQEINAYALPILRQETLTAQSATIDSVSGATVTSDGYLQSLQSALDAAHLA